VGLGLLYSGTWYWGWHGVTVNEWDVDLVAFDAHIWEVYLLCNYLSVCT
jgi:hypothetical protein